MRVILVDDESLATEFLATQLKKIASIEVVAKYTNPLKALDELDKLNVDVIFLDMEMGKLHGLEFAEIIMSRRSDIEILFVTAHPQFALEAFEVNAIDYLLKPVRMERLEQAVARVSKKIKINKLEQQKFTNQNSSLEIKSLGSFRLLNIHGEIVKWRTRKAKELFAYLWYHKNSPVHKERIIEELWSDVDYERATTLLHTTIYQLRQTCKKLGITAPVKYANDQYTLTVPIKSDLEELESLFSKQITSETIKRVIELYEGDFLFDESYTWAVGFQQHLIKSMLIFLEKAINLLTYIKDEAFLLEECLEIAYKMEQTNEQYIIKLIDYYDKNNKIEKLANLTTKILHTYENELNIPLPAKIKSRLN